MPKQSPKIEKNATIPRPPVVAVMGHIDHGKTTLLDYIRKTGVAEKEAGGITQKVSAYEIEHTTSDGKTIGITFIDTPGHEAFAGVRSRGASVADIAVLVISGEDGVKPQTVEALKFITESKLPYIVAITKMDKPSANADRAKQSMLEHEIYVEGYGGSVPCVSVSSKTGEGVKDLLDMIALVADMENISGNPDKSAEGFVLEACRSKEKGIMATLIVKNGTLKKGMTISAGNSLSVLRMMENFSGKKIETAPPGTPILASGWDSMPIAGNPFLSFADKKQAEQYIEEIKNKTAKKTANAQNPAETRLPVPIVIKADALGTLEAIEQELKKLATDKIFLKIIFAGTGDVNESDVKTATANGKALLFCFNVKIDGPAVRLAERDNVLIEQFSVIYKLIERAQEIAIEREPKIEVQEIRGKAKIMRFFSSVKDKQVIGGKVLEGSIGTGNEFKIMRRETEVGKGKIRELQQQKTKTSEVAKDREFGALVEAKIEIAPGDVLETFVMVTK